MNKFTHEEIKKILDTPETLYTISNIINKSEEVTTHMLNRLLKEPEYSAEFQDYINSEERSEELKAFLKGEEKGKVEGVYRGRLEGCIGTIFFGILLMFLSRK